ncbi:MAG: hypothetical protein ACI4O7_00010 [Aristaeellaceae bacterium]
MARYCYAITMETPLGDRRGQLSLDCEHGICQGVMTLLGTRSSITGTLEPGGKCELRGLLCTLLQTIPYTAAGMLNPERLSLTLRAGSRCFRLDGEGKELE